MVFALTGKILHIVKSGLLPNLSHKRQKYKKYINQLGQESQVVNKSNIVSQIMYFSTKS